LVPLVAKPQGGLVVLVHGQIAVHITDMFGITRQTDRGVDRVLGLRGPAQVNIAVGIGINMNARKTGHMFGRQARLHLGRDQRIAHIARGLLVRALRIGIPVIREGEHRAEDRCRRDQRLDESCLHANLLSLRIKSAA
jgi:hypothetical protein